jgi:hypothetical protein
VGGNVAGTLNVIVKVTVRSLLALQAPGTYLIWG